MKLRWKRPGNFGAWNSQPAPDLKHRYQIWQSDAGKYGVCRYLVAGKGWARHIGGGHHPFRTLEEAKAAAQRDADGEATALSH